MRPPRTPGTPDTDLIVVGGGPAGCAAARMAASVGMRSVLVEPEALCRTLHRIPALDNVLGGHTSGPGLAGTIAAELRSTELCRLALGRYATEVRAHDDRVTVTLYTGLRLTAPHTVVATGTGPRRPRDVPWITAPVGPALPALWQADATEAEGRTLLVLGGDRPLGTFLRAHPATGTRLLAAYPEADDYKTEEIRHDPRVVLLPVRHLTLHPPAARLLDRSGGHRTVTADAVFLNLGNTPAAPPGDLVRDASGHCPPAAQHPRVLVAGDLRSACFQRVMTAFGSGTEAALRAYYSARDLPDENTP
ncbi:FAD-dependent oxidoreductase [Streptomyces sp. LP05-1]|uniref:FAD-dependent oxidoreductase n=1 Tax=Streptomyces pyxinae TaxID=2970734 RepID=A0ABT2CN28_9ACTN|nr:FAD-dependent oxidoreductase [Streptomyces sp. LP05-1]MCS0638838.1 FAD-dependent oxidoreductase [Streptomyces sp. LP05-1]